MTPGICVTISAIKFLHAETSTVLLVLSTVLLYQTLLSCFRIYYVIEFGKSVYTCTDYA